MCQLQRELRNSGVQPETEKDHFIRFKLNYNIPLYWKVEPDFQTTGCFLAINSSSSFSF